VILGPLNTTDGALSAAADTSHSVNDQHKKHLLLVSAEAFVDEDLLRSTLSKRWAVHALKGALRAREALLIGVRPQVLVIDLATESEAMLGLIERIKRSADLKIKAIDVVALKCPAGSIKSRAIGFGVSVFVDHSEALLSVLGMYLHAEDGSVPMALEPVVLASTVPAPAVPAPAVPAPTLLEPVEQAPLLGDSVPVQHQLDESVLAWVRDQTERRMSPSEIEAQERLLASSGLLLHGKLYFHQIDFPKSEARTDLSKRTPSPPRPLRLALLKQQLRAGDGLMADNKGQFWLSLQTDNELKAIRVALRLAVALTRSSDPRHFVVGVALSGAYLSNDAAIAMQICQDTLPEIEPSGQLAVAVDRWKFSLPLLVAQALV
jgi:hypothetical protein